MRLLPPELVRGASGVARLAWRAAPSPRPDLLALSSRLLPPPITDRLGALLRQVPPERLESLLRLPPVRRALLEAIFWQIPLYLDASRVAGTPAAIRWQLAGRGDGTLDVYDVVIVDGRTQIVRGGGDPAPRLTVTVDPLELLRIAAGRSDPLGAYLAGRLSVRGDLIQAARLMSLFRFPARAAARQPSVRRGAPRSAA